MNNVAYMLWIQEVAVVNRQAVASQEMQKKCNWFVLRHEIDCKNRAFEGEEIIATTWVGKATKIKCVRFTEIWRGKEVLVEAKSIWCLLDFKTQRPKRISVKLKRTFGME